MVLIFQVKDRQKKKQPTKCIRIDAEGDATLEELEEAGRQDNGEEPCQELEKTKSSNKKVCIGKSRLFFSRFSSSCLVDDLWFEYLLKEKHICLNVAEESCFNSEI